ncbi:MAG: alpha/beta fold hydrolase [Bacteriovorax sp.]|nr:alpha/beta fold hydrolase [Bacteriovorax sp.]
MKPNQLTVYCASFLTDHARGPQIFFHSQTEEYSYEELIKTSLLRTHYFINSPDNFFALKIESSFKLFTCLLGAVLAQKRVLIISSKEPAASVSKFQESVFFTKILTDDDLLNLSDDFSFPNINVDPTAPAFYIMSSGSSGPAKGIPLSLNNVFYSAESIIDFFHMTSADISFSNLPHHHIGGLMIFWRAFFSGGKVTKDESQNYQFISLVPLQLQRILENDLKTKKLQQCRGVLVGGAPLDDKLKNAAEKKHIPVFETYGMSEASSLVMLNGKPLKGQMVKLDAEGYFLIKGKTLTDALAVDAEGFYHTKDIGIQNPDGSFSFKQRGDLLFKSGGELVNPFALEAKVKELSWISEAIVVPVKHHEWTHAGAMIYKTSDDSKLGHDLKEHLKIFFHPHLIPKYFIEAPENLIQEEIKPRRFDISEFAQEQYFKSLFHYLYIPHAHSKKLMVFFHGFMEDHSDMIPLMDNHKETSYLFIDIPGHGRTTVNNFKSRTSVFAELISLIQFYSKQHPVTLYGYSMGGRIAIELTIMGLCPEKLILESCHFGLATKEEKQKRLQSDRNLLEKDDLDLSDFFESWYKNPIFGDYNKSSHYIIDVQKKIYHNPKEWQASLEFFSPGAFPYEQKDVVNELSKIQIEGIVGSDDSKYEKHFQEMKTRLPLLSINIIENCGHNPHKTKLPEVKKILGFSN